MSVTLHQVTKYYGKQKALDAISFELKKGEICGFLGPNGAGKSTTMKIITGYLADFEGEVTICGTDIRHAPLRARQAIGYLPEHNPLYPDMYIPEYLLHVARLYGITQPASRVEAVIRRTGLVPEIRKKIGELSKGYRQRVGLAQALVHDPEVLILDEPMTGLDPNQLEEIRTLIQAIGRDKTILLSTHIMQEVEAICNRAIIIREGRIIADSPVESIRHGLGSGRHILVRFTPDSNSDWLGDNPLFRNAVRLAPDSWQLPDSDNGEDLRIALFNEAASRHCPIIELKTEEHALEEIFHKLTQQNLYIKQS
ncbi:MAG: ATP-binding cassette domain-containing protein [Odoribacter sp.]|nr:ATP-binding cassette domain-containing protein [Odoribacter sp.]